MFDIFRMLKNVWCSFLYKQEMDILETGPVLIEIFMLC